MSAPARAPAHTPARARVRARTLNLPRLIDLINRTQTPCSRRRPSQSPAPKHPKSHPACLFIMQLF